MATQSNLSDAQALSNHVGNLRKQLKELGHRDCHSCYVCYDDWAYFRKRCFDRQQCELNIQLLVAVSDLVATDSDATPSPSNPPISPLTQQGEE